MRVALLALPLLALAAPAAAQSLVGPTHTGNATPEMYGVPMHSATPLTSTSPRYRPGTAPVERVAADRIVLDRKGYRIGKIDAVDGDSAMIRHAKGTTRVPLKSINMDSWGVLRMNISAREFAAKAADS